MGVMDTVRKWIGVEGEDPDIEEAAREEREQDQEQAEPIRTAPTPIPVRPAREQRMEEKRGRNSSMAQPSDHTQVVLICPTSFDEATSIADHLCQQHAVVLNLEGADRDTTRRLVDFVSGVAYANQGNVRRVAKKTFLITPTGVETLGELMEETGADQDGNF